MVTISNFWSDDFNLANRNTWFSSFLVRSNPLSRKFWLEPQALEYWINWEIYIQYAGAAGMVLQTNGSSQWENWNRNVLFLNVNFKVYAKVCSTLIIVCGIIYLKLDGIDAINKITKLKIIWWKDIFYTMYSYILINKNFNQHQNKTEQRCNETSGLFHIVSLW
jgi:hypothetical protein